MIDEINGGIDGAYEPRITKIAETEKMNAACKIQPDFIYNRFDVIYDGNFDLYEITEYDETSCIPVHIDKKRAYIGVWLSEIPSRSFGNFIEFIFSHYRKVDKIILRYSLNNHKGLKTTNHWKVDLEKNKEKLRDKQPHGLRININHINRDFRGCKVNKYSVPKISNQIIEKYFEFKNATHGTDYRMSPKEYLKAYFVTSAYCLLINNNIEAVLLICELNDIVYLENITYNKVFSKYGLGIVLYDHLLKDLIRTGKKELYLGDGNQEYKRRFCGENQFVFDGVIARYPIAAIIDNVKQSAKSTIKRLVAKPGRRFSIRRHV